jgi:hypothetical protein
MSRLLQWRLKIVFYKAALSLSTSLLSAEVGVCTSKTCWGRVVEKGGRPSGRSFNATIALRL